MAFDVTDLLENLFGSTVPVVEVAQPAEPADTPANPLSANPFAGWVYRPDSQGRMGWQTPDLPEVVPFEALSLPGEPCTRCGSLEKWWDILGGEHCQQCERATLEKSIRWADRAARLRKRALPQEPAPRIAPGCVAKGQVDILGLGGNQPLQGQLWGCNGA